MTPLRCTALAAIALLPAATIAMAQPVASPRPQLAAHVPELTAASATVKPGDTLVLTGRGFPRNSHLVLLAGPLDADGKRIGGALTGRRGTFTAKIQIRARSSAAALVARACFDACRIAASARFRIVTP
ncbi:MAG: hypothetical protein ACTHOE_16550 [Conexibacter sp.]